MTATDDAPTAAFDDLGGWPAVIGRLLAGADLGIDVAAGAMTTILRGDATPAQIAGFAVALRAKGESSDELSGMLAAALAAGEVVPLTDAERAAAIDVVGTGGDGSQSINVSTMAAFVAAGAGVPVCKHGNRSASSRCGTADVLELLGVTIELGPEGVAHCIREAGIGFCFAPAFHPAFRHAGPPRREIGVPTVFNLIGPMANPGAVRRQLIGVADPRRAPAMVDALRARGVDTAWVVHGDGLDELSTAGPSDVFTLNGGVAGRMTVDARELGLTPVTADELRGGTPEENARIVRDVLGGGGSAAHRDIVVLNAGAALVVAGRCRDLAAGLDLAAATIDAGAALAALDRLIAESAAVAG